MTAVPSIIRLNSETPVAPAGFINSRPQQDGGFPINSVTLYTPNLGFVDARTTTTEDIRDASYGKLVTLTNASPITAALDSANVPAGFMAFILVAGAGAATLTPSTGTVNGVASVTLNSGQAAIVFFDGTNWEAMTLASSGGGGGGILGGVNLQTGTTYTVLSSDQGKLVVLSNAAAVAVTLDSTLSATYVVAALFQGAAGGTLTPSSGTINGAASLTLTTGQSAWAFFDGTNWWAMVSGAGGTAGLVIDKFTPSSPTTVFVATETPSGAVEVLYNGIGQAPGTDYSVSGSTVTALTFSATSGETVLLVYGSVGGGTPTDNFDPLDPSVWWFREDWTASPAGLLNWSSSNWVAGAPFVAIVGFNDPNFFRAMRVLSDGATGDGSRVWLPIQQQLTTGASWRSRAVFKLTSTTNIRALMGFGNIAAATVAPLPWFVGIRYDTTIGDTNFMVGMGASDGSSGAFADTGVPADVDRHDLLMAYVDNDHVAFSLDGGAPIVVANTPLDGSIGVSPGIWGYSDQNSFPWGIYAGLFAMEYTGLSP